MFSIEGRARGVPVQSVWVLYIGGPMQQQRKREREREREKERDRQRERERERERKRDRERETHGLQFYVWLIKLVALINY